MDWGKFDDCLARAKTARTVVKIVIFDEVDYDWARDVARRYDALPLYLQPGNHTPPPPDAEDAIIDIEGIIDRMQWLVEKTLGDRWFTPHILPQLHTLIWGNKRGV